MTKIKYIVGDALQPIGDGNKIICHICNTIGVWGAGFVIAISRKWLEPELAYRSKKEYDLGTTDFIGVTNDIVIANMIAQESIMDYHTKGVKNINAKPPIRYAAVEECLKEVNEIALMTNATIHAPKFGSGLAGGDWSIIATIIEKVITVPVTIYVLNENDLPIEKHVEIELY